MADEDEPKKGQNLEMIVSKLAKEKPTNGNIILISGVNIENLSFPGEPEGESDDCEPDLHQCGKCKRMFSMLEKYLQHRANKSCRKRHADSVDVMSDEGGSPRQAPEIVQMEATGSSGSMADNDNTEMMELASRRKHDRKGVARKRTSFSRREAVPNGVNNPEPSHVNMNGVSEMITPNYNNSPTLPSINNYRTVYQHPAMPNNDLYSLMELTKNSSIKEVHIDENGVATSRPREMLNGHVLPIFHHSSLNSPPNPRYPAPFAVHNHLPSLPPTQEAVHFTEKVLHPEPILVSYPAIENPEVSQKTGEKRRFKCDKCDRDFNQRANLRRHQLVHSGEKPFECDQCHRRFQQQGDLKRHMLRHAEVTWYHCRPCDKRFMRIDRYKAHMRGHVENGRLPTSDGTSMVSMNNGAVVSTEEGDTAEKPVGSHHICSKCNQTFTEPDELLAHLCSDSITKVSSAPVETTKSGGAELEPEAAVKMAEQYVKAQAADADHSRAYSSSRSSRGKLTNPHKCPMCNAHYKNEDSLQAHILKHSGEKKYKCDQCPKAFFTSSNLKIHRRIHSGDKPLKCKVCFKAFSDPSNFNKHKKSHMKGKLDHKGTPKKGRKRDVKPDHGGFNETMVEAIGKDGDTYESPTREFLQNQYEALLPALEEDRVEGAKTGSTIAEVLHPDAMENTFSDEHMKYSVSFVESPSY